MKEREHERASPEKSDEKSRPRVRPSADERRATSQNVVSRLQQTLGNDAVVRLLKSGTLHAKLRVSEPGDADEIEADRVADQVVTSPAPATLHRKCACTGGATCPECQEEEVESAKGIHRKAEQSSQQDTSVANDFVQALGPGYPLDPATRQSMESRFGQDFSRVRVHTDEGAAESARSINARAYTFGNDVVFDSGAYAPQATEGRKLLAHELVHVAQQRRDADRDTANFETTNGKPEANPIQGPGRNLIHRRANANAVTQMDVAAIKADPDYIDNGLVKMTFYGAEEADLFYSDGAVLRLGLVPRYVTSPFQSVDYHSARSEYAEYQESPKSLKFVPDVRHLPSGPGTTYGEVLQKYSKAVAFSVEPQSGKIVPNHVNPVTAPFLCKFLQQAEAEYVQNFDAIAKGMVKVLEKFKIILELELFRVTLPTGGLPRAATGAAAAKAFDAARLADELYMEARVLQNPGRMMLRAATKLSGMAELSAGQKAAAMLEFFKRIGFAISKSGVQDAAEYILMRSEDEKYAFKIIKATGKFLYGKFDVAKLDYVWTEL